MLQMNHSEISLIVFNQYGLMKSLSVPDFKLPYLKCRYRLGILFLRVGHRNRYQ